MFLQVHWAALYGKRDALKLLVSRGGLPDKPSTVGSTAVHYAAGECFDEYSPVPNCRGFYQEGGVGKMGKRIGKFWKLSMGVCKVGVILLIMISCE